VPFSVRFFSWILLAFGALGMVYFLALLLGLPFWLIVGLWVLAAAALGWWLFRGPLQEQMRWPFALLLAFGCSLMVLQGLPQTEDWGGWDAWAIWNHRAAFLQHPQAWRAALDGAAAAHPDYPLTLPAGLAALQRMMGVTEDNTVAIAVAWTTLFCAVLLLAGSLARHSRWLAIAAVLVLAFDNEFLKNALSQYADTLVGLCLLVAVVAYRWIGADKRAPALCGSALGLCALIKNEGVIIAALGCLILISARRTRQEWRRFAAGFLPGIAAWLLFNTILSPAGDMTEGGLSAMLPRLANAKRYRVVWDGLCATVRASYALPAWLLASYAALRIARKEKPGADFCLLLATIGAYCGIYLITPHDPAWHIATSLDRLLHQLLPATLAVCLRELARLRLPKTEASSIS